jgi:hypothetical protein
MKRQWQASLLVLAWLLLLGAALRVATYVPPLGSWIDCEDMIAPIVSLPGRKALSLVLDLRSGALEFRDFRRSIPVKQDELLRWQLFRLPSSDRLTLATTIVLTIGIALSATYQFATGNLLLYAQSSFEMALFRVAATALITFVCITQLFLKKPL